MIDDKYFMIYWNKSRFEVFGDDGRSNFTLEDRDKSVVTTNFKNYNFIFSNGVPTISYLDTDAKL